MNDIYYTVDFIIPFMRQITGEAVPDFFDEYELHIYNPNATQTNYSDIGNTTNDVLIFFDEISASDDDRYSSGNNVQIFNFGNEGYNYVTNWNSKTCGGYFNIGGIINRTAGTITIPKVESGNASNTTGSYAYGQYYVRLGSNSYSLIPAAFGLTYTNYTHVFANWSTDYYKGYISSQSGGSIVGSYKEEVYDNKGANTWETAAGGSLDGVVYSYVIDLRNSPWKRYFDNNTGVSYNGSLITPPSSAYNTSVAINITSASLEENVLSISGNLRNISNAGHIDHYELYYIIGESTSLAGKTVDANTGISGAISLGTETASTLSASATTFSKTIVVDDAKLGELMATGNGENVKITLFVKAVHNPNHSMISSTYHALTPVTVEVVQADVATPNAIVTLDGIVSDGTTFNFAEKATVEFSAEDGATIYYTLDGPNPTSASARYTTPIKVTENTVIKAVAYLGGKYSNIKIVSLSKFVPNAPSNEVSASKFKLIMDDNFAGMGGNTPSIGMTSNNGSYPVFNSSNTATSSTIFKETLLNNPIKGMNCYQANGRMEMYNTSTGSPGMLQLALFNGSYPVYLKVKGTSWYSGSNNQINIYLKTETGTQLGTTYSMYFTSSGQTKTETYAWTPGYATCLFHIFNGFSNAPLTLDKVEILGVPICTPVTADKPSFVDYYVDEVKKDNLTFSFFKGSNNTLVEGSLKNQIHVKNAIAALNILDYDFNDITGFSSNYNSPTTVGIHHLYCTQPYFPEAILYQPVMVNGAVGFRYYGDLVNRTSTFGTVATGFTLDAPLTNAESFTINMDYRSDANLTTYVTVIGKNATTGEYTTNIISRRALSSTNGSWSNGSNVTFTRAAITDLGLDPSSVRISVSAEGTSGSTEAQYLYVKSFKLTANNVAAGANFVQTINVIPSPDGNFNCPADFNWNENYTNSYFISARGITHDAGKYNNYSEWVLPNGEMIPVDYHPAPVFSGVKYNPVDEFTTHQEYQNNSEYHGYILCTVTSENVVVGLSQHNHPSANAIAACPLVMDETGTVYNDDEVDVREFYIGGNENDRYYFWCREGGINKVLATDPDNDDLFLETKTEAVNNGHIYRCSIEFADKSKSLRRINRLNPGVTLPAATISFSDNSMKLNSADDAFIANVDDGAPIYLFASENWKTTGVENLINTEAQVIVDGRAVVIIGSDSPVSIANLAGIVVYNGNERHVELIPGIYIVTIDGRSTKIAIE